MEGKLCLAGLFWRKSQKGCDRLRQSSMNGPESWLGVHELSFPNGGSCRVLDKQTGAKPPDVYSMKIYDGHAGNVHRRRIVRYGSVGGKNDLLVYQICSRRITRSCECYTSQKVGEQRYLTSQLNGRGFRLDYICVQSSSRHDLVPLLI